ncbi:sulfatase family protein [Cyclobacterium qasimii]|uniref:Choline-sulfatase n=1 Tax=Cyclobacterium qasimii TaxID=1350429 RepID=A0A512CBA8_9BACT|nr:sulfatase-like hydrolase/transferase [Cyclobacterium qasimii]GEO21450.1 choline-sulfatase [Cyclobacterium qasimii]
MKKSIVLLLVCLINTVLLAQSKKPNILIIITDQQNAKMMSSAGNEWLETPNMDKLAMKGMRFEKAYVTNPVCSPSRFSIFTGQYPTAIDMRHNGSKLDIPTLQEIIPNAMGHTFTNAGYETFYGGKSHLPGAKNDVSIYGFETFISKDERDDLAKESAALLLDRNSDKPFLVALNFINPHDICYEAIRHFPPNNRPPADVPVPLLEAIAIPDSISENDFMAKYVPPLPANFEPTVPEPSAIYDLKELHSFTIDARENWTERDWRMHRYAYHRLTEKVDVQIGTVLDALESSPFADNTIVVFTSDHGEMSASHRLEHKTVFYEESSNIPLVVWYKDMANGHSVDTENIVSNGLDLFPTLCELAGISSPENMQGVSFATLLNGQEKKYSPREYLFMENELGFMIRGDNLKYTLYDNGDEMLIDLGEDPGEMINLVEVPSYFDKKEKLKKLLEAHIEQANH